ncbi:ABC transporter ATP-binding protein [Roseomonas sp. HJA6]|uniref:ABC transporter ATP-binding protein n=1 Tax=Roseomonas alba TaxID=2846776 RepID=A0ABS7AAI3_9PROT|nr:ABC transporter ATP-binding protein [Neoroseomonas alba]MBW6399313.1 ABC transporter ATP-binding protein [Neoroseomonas alba]
MAHVQLSDLSKRYGVFQAVETVSMEVQSGEFLTLLGPSGCGKTTTLRMVAGLVPPTTGTVRIDGRDVTALSAAQRGIGMVFQSLALFPHMTVTENVAFGLKMRRVAPAEIARRVRSLLEIVRLAHLADRYPNQLSGGQQQRVALARALVIEPSILILDEPFGALDRKLREAMQVELRQITRDLHITALFVTHDQEEALMLSDLVAVMNQGRVEQLGTPQEVFRAPRTRFVADFMGVTNFLKGRWSGGVLLAGGGALPGPLQQVGADGSTVELAIRPEEVLLQPGAEATTGALTAAVLQAVYHGTSTSYTLRLPDGQTLMSREPNDGASGYAPLRFSAGDAVTARWRPEAVHLLQS